MTRLKPNVLDQCQIVLLNIGQKLLHVLARSVWQMKDVFGVVNHMTLLVRLTACCENRISVELRRDHK